VAGAIGAHLEQTAEHMGLTCTSELALAEQITARVRALAEEVRASAIDGMADLVRKATLSVAGLKIELYADQLAKRLELEERQLDERATSITAPMTIRRRGHEMKLVTGAEEPRPDPKLIDGLRRAHAWSKRLKAGEPLRAIAQSHKASDRYTARIIALATLAPDIQAAIVEGRQPVELTLKALVKTDIPVCWHAQRERLGFGQTNS
jgi:site-specific DNA recombinase